MPTPSDSFPQQFGPYVLIRVLGVGGMGDVFLALAGKPGMERPCVVKRLAQHATSEDSERFRREANLARKLSHGAIAQTLAVDEIDGELVIAQEFLHGCSLSGLLATCLRQREQVPLRLAVHVAREIARALSYAHEQGVIHRDIAPDNVMLTFTGEVRLLDFGIARTTTDPRLTRPGWSVGRAAYAAPEVAAGTGGDPRSDVYSLGLLLWQLLARRPPPVEETLLPPSKLNPEVSRDLDEVVLRAAAREPQDRFQRADELIKALGAHLPADFSGEREVAAFLQMHYDVAKERELVAEDVARGRAFVQSGQGTSTPGGSVERAPAGRARPGLLLAGAAAVFVAVVVVVGIRARQEHPTPEKTLAAPAIPPLAPAASGPEAVSAPVASVPPQVPTPPAPRPISPRRQLPHPVPDRTDTVQTGSPAAVVSADLLADAQQRFDTGDIDGALRSARAAIRAGGGAPAHLLAGRALGKKNQLQDAERELAIAVRLDPTSTLAAQRLREVRERLRATLPSLE